MSDKQQEVCPKCGDSLIEGKLYCANCGLALVPTPERAAVDAYVEARVRQAVDARMADQGTLVRQIADDAEDVVWTRIKRYTWAAGIVLAVLGLFGFGSFQQAKSTIITEARSRLDPVITDTEQRVKAAQGEIANTNQKIAAVKTQLDDTSKQAQEQSNRIKGKGAEIDAKLQQLQDASNRANELSNGYQKKAADFQRELQEMRANAEAENRRLEDTQKVFSSKIEQVTKQIDNVAIQQAYPSLGTKMYVTYNGQPWKGVAAKKPSDKWVNINLDPMAIGEARVTATDLQTLADKLEKRGYTPLFGFFGFGGPVSSGYGCLGGFQEGLIYFDSTRQREADDLAKLARDTLHFSDLPVHLGSTPDKTMRFVVENSGVDFQVCIGRSR